MRTLTFVPKVVVVATGTLIESPINPDFRTEAGKSLTKLEEGIIEAGGIIQPIIVSNDWRVIDGHRRLQAAKNLGYAEVPVIKSPLSLQIGWRILNDTSLAIQSDGWVQAHYKGMAIENIPKPERTRITEIKRLIGDEGFTEIAEREMSSHVLNVAKFAARYIEQRKGNERATDETTRSVLLWLIRLRQQFAVRSAIKQGMNPKVLRYSIENNLEISTR